MCERDVKTAQSGVRQRQQTWTG